MKIFSLFIIAILAVIAVVAVTAQYDFSLDHALDAIKYAKISYCPASDIQSWNCDACSLHANFQVYNVYTNSSIESQAYSGFDPTRNEVVVAFRGSYNIPNWINDLDAFKVPYPYCDGCEVHQGFWEEWQSYETPLINDVQTLLQQNPGASIGCYAHSLGAAVAIHAVATFNRLQLAPVINEYSFGTPRTGNAAWSEWVYLIARTSQGRTQRIVNARDPVPHLPLMDMGFLHTPHETWAKEGGTSPLVNCADGSGYEDPNCSDSIIVPDVMDHLNYLGMSTECNTDSATSTNKKALEISPDLKKKLYKAMREAKVHKMNKKK
jgi:predicted lipase